jgi:peptidoglycan/xylan/chitin deacetylase (PgdA/CDA1 family)
MSFKERFFSLGILYRWIPTSFLMKLSGKKVVFPFYHYVTTTEEQDFLTRYLYRAKTKEEFIKDVRYLKKCFFSVSITDLPRIREEKTKFYFFLSFDDGLRNFYEVVAPILKQENVDAINFINTNFIGNQDVFYRYKINLFLHHLEENTLTDSQRETIKKTLQLSDVSIPSIKTNVLKLKKSNLPEIDELLNSVGIDIQKFLKDKKPYMTKSQIQEIQHQHFFIGAHSKSHPYYADLSYEEQVMETQESISILQEEYEMRLATFAFPFSDDGVSCNFFEYFSDVITFGTAGVKDEEKGIQNIQRIPMEYSSVYDAETIVKGELIIYIVKKLFSKHRIKRAKNS